MNNFNLIAPFYDGLAKLVFGGSLLESQIHFLSEITQSDSVLILGGGTGKLLTSLPNCREIDFFDLSEKMINTAKKRECNSRVNFIHDDFLHHHFNCTYDVIVCPFFLDCFDYTNLRLVLMKIKELLNKDGRLLISDFQKTNGNRFLLKSMHLFFRTFSSLESKELANIHRETLSVGLQIRKEKIFHRNMIFSRLYGNL